MVSQKPTPTEDGDSDALPSEQTPGSNAEEAQGSSTPSPGVSDNSEGMISETRRPAHMAPARKIFIRDGYSTDTSTVFDSNRFTFY